MNPGELTSETSVPQPVRRTTLSAENYEKSPGKCPKAQELSTWNHDLRAFKVNEFSADREGL